MKKKIIFAIIFLLIISLFTIKIQPAPASPEKTLEATFAASGARIVSSEIYFSGKLKSNGFKNDEAMKTLIDSIGEAFGLVYRPGDISSLESDTTSGFELNCSKDSFRNVHISVVKDKPGGETDNCYVNASMVDTSEKPVLAETENKVLEVFKGRGIDPRINSCISGNFRGKLGDSELNLICGRIFESVHASKVEGIRDMGLISVSAYTPDIGRSVEVNGSRINLNLAIRYNSYEDKTYIWLATPVITTEY